MRKKPQAALIAVCLAFALITAFLSAYLLFNKKNYVRCNKINLGEDMKIENQSATTDYQELVKELERKYLEKVCDVFSEAKSNLLSALNDLLGDRYKTLNDEIQKLKSDALNLRKNFDEKDETVALKEKLEAAKEDFVTATNEEDRAAKKVILNSVLSEIAQRNLNIFSSTAAIRRKIDEKCIEAADLLKSKEGEYKALETKIVDAARKKTLELAVSYKSEISALSFAFDQPYNEEKVPFLTAFDLNMRLMDFDKEKFMSAYLKNAENCPTACSGNCLSCGLKDKEKNYYTSPQKDDYNN